MANHAGGHFMHDVLILLHERGVWSQIGPDATRDILKRILEIGSTYDCPQGDILSEAADRLGYCQDCMDFRDDVRWTVCRPCRIRDYGTADVDED